MVIVRLPHNEAASLLGEWEGRVDGYGGDMTGAASSAVPSAQAGPAAYEIAEALRALQWRLRRAAGPEMEDLGVTPAQARALHAVARFAEPPTMGALAQRLHVSPRSVTDLVDGLEQAGLLRREQDP